MCPGLAEWWLDHKGTKNPENPGMLQQYKVTAQCASTLCEMQSMNSLGGSGGMTPRKILKKLLYEIEFCSNFDHN